MQSQLRFGLVPLLLLGTLLAHLRLVLVSPPAEYVDLNSRTWYNSSAIRIHIQLSPFGLCNKFF
jgi:hypothetical protein